MGRFQRVLVISALAVSAFACAAGQTDYNTRGVRLMQEGRYSEAYAMFERAYQKNPQSPFSLNNMGYVYEMKYQNYIKAVELYEKALERCTPADRVHHSTDEEAVQKPLEELIKENVVRALSKL